MLDPAIYDQHLFSFFFLPWGTGKPAQHQKKQKKNKTKKESHTNIKSLHELLGSVTEWRLPNCYWGARKTAVTNTPMKLTRKGEPKLPRKKKHEIICVFAIK